MSQIKKKKLYFFNSQTNTSRGQSPYPPAHSQNSGSYPSSPQQQQQAQQQQQQATQQPGGVGAPGAPAPPSGPSQQQQQQNTPPTSQYSPYPQRYPTPPGLPTTGPNHRTAYTTHQVGINFNILNYLLK